MLLYLALVAVSLLGNSAAVRVDVDTSKARDLEGFGRQIK
ncbi:unnamed protein product, partial [Allacma fusca]